MSAVLRMLSVAELVESTRRRDGFNAPELDGAGNALLERAFGRPIDPETAVREIIRTVRARGDIAVREWTSRLDGVDVAETRISEHVLSSAWADTKPSTRAALSAAADRIRAFHEHQHETANRGSNSAYLRPEPLHRVGCYVPGGRAAYPSTVLMSVIPAWVAGVESVVIASPPAESATVHELVAAAATLLGVGEVHAVGGAQAIAALAYGTGAIARVDKIVGPGNAFVTLAKRAVFGDVGIDQLAGPSEILVIASDGADPAFIAADLVSQLEHDPLAWAVCLTDDARLAGGVVEHFASAAASAQRGGIIAAAAGRNAAVVVCASLDEALDVAEAFAPEHLSLQGTAAEALRDRVRAAGAIFCGAMSPVSIGDYVAGPNHTLPTQGAARYRGPLSVADFMRWPSVVQLSASELEGLAPIACELADAEGLPGHAVAIRARLAVLEGTR